MPEPATLKVNEIFWSAQGEGAESGRSSIFLRLAGCTLQCPYCDTKRAWQGGQFLTIAHILSEIGFLREKYPPSQVVISGGEPLQQDLSGLVGELKLAGHRVAVETNGLYFQDLGIDWWTVSPKDVNDYHIHPSLHARVNEVKLVVTEKLDLDGVKKTRNIGPGFPIFLQPNFYDPDRYKNTFSLFRRCQEQGIPGIRLGIQMHAIYKIN